MKYFFIAGCFRSGTTLMRLCMESHSEVKCFDESKSASILFGNKDEPVDFAEIPDDNVIKAIGYKIPHHTERLGEIATSFDDQPLIIGLIRNPVDVVASMRKLSQRRSDTTLGELLKRGFGFSETDVQAFSVENPSIWTIYQEACEMDHENIARAALLWVRKNRALRGFKSLGIDVHEVQYEDFVTHPNDVLEALLQKLGLEWEQSVIEHHLHEHSEARNGIAIGGTVVSRPIDKNSIGKGQVELSAIEQDLVKRITEDYIS